MKANRKILVIKASGEKEFFNEEKVRLSIRRAGIEPHLEEELIEQIYRRLYPNITTREIYNQILDFLDKSAYPEGKTRYSLKRAIMSLGPSGYPFEKFLAQVLASRGFKTQTGLILKGACVDHEVDIVVQKEKELYPMECKYHNHPGVKTDIKTALYVKARFDDLKAGETDGRFGGLKFTQAWLATNTKFTTQVVKYGRCAGVRLLSWDYPPNGSLREWVEAAQLYPITCLFSLSQSQKKNLLEQGIVLCRDLLLAKEEVFRQLGWSDHQVQKVLNEAGRVAILKK